MLTTQVSVIPPTAEIHLGGELDFLTAPYLLDVARNVARGEHLSIVLNLADLDFVDTAGLRVIVRLARMADARSSTVILASAAPFTVRLLHLTGFDWHLAASGAVVVPANPRRCRHVT